METREFFIVAFAEAQPLGEQSSAYSEHFTFLGYLRPDPNAVQRLTIAEHLEAIALAELTLPGKKMKRMGRMMATILDDPTGELVAAKDKLFAALLADGYICSRKSFYEDRYTPHVSMDPKLKPKKLSSFTLTNLAVTESRFDFDYDFLGAEVIHSRSL